MTVTYNQENKTARQLGRHSDHASKLNDIRLIELRNLLRTKLFDPKLNHDEIRKIYQNCVYEFKDIVLPVGHYKKTVEALLLYRNRAQQNGMQNANGEEKQQVNTKLTPCLPSMENKPKGAQTTENRGVIKATNVIITKPIEVMRMPVSK